ncbi:MAG: MFS transporter, partial [Betaproteobacteria bacterium]
MHKTPARQGHDWRTIGALNTASTLAQVGQFGIAYVVVPVWLADRGLDATQLGLFAASLWLGQLPGLGLAPRLSQQFGARWVIVAGLLCSVAALACIALTGWPGGLLGGALAGFGLGLRWIGLEPWLYRIAPADARGRLVGIHESLIALAPVIAPWLAGRVGLQGRAIFWIGGVFTLVALVPLAFARDAPPP